MPKTLLCKISLLISWISILSHHQVKGSSLYRTHVPDANFPYAYWKPGSSSSFLPTPERYVGEPLKEDYNHYFGNPVNSEKHNDVNKWKAPPIKVPKDIIGEANERTTVSSSPINAITSYPSSFSPQYGRHPGGTEATPLYFPQSFAVKNSVSVNNNDMESSYSHYTPMESHSRRQIWTQNVYNNNNRNSKPSAEPFFPSEAKQNYQSIPRPAKIIPIIQIDRNQEPAPHVFYAVEHPSQVNMKILQKNGTHVSYVTPEEQRRRTIIEQKGKSRNQKKRVYQTNKQKHNTRNYNRYNQKKNVNRYSTRKQYNENLIDLFKSKVDNKVRNTYRVRSSTPHSIRKPTIKKGTEISRKSLLNTHSIDLDHNFITEPVKNFNKTKFTFYETTPIPLIPQPTNINQKYTKAHPHVVYPTRPYPPLHYNVDQSQNVHNFFTGATVSRTPKPAPNAYPETQAGASNNANQYLYIYNKNKVAEYDKEGETYDFDTQSLVERMAAIQQIPASLVIPGGLAALGFGLAYYYFNYIWYPTPVVTARLSEFLRSFGSQSQWDRSHPDSSIVKIVDVFRAIEGAQFNSEFGKDSCRNRIVCQLHQDIPNLWDATNIISPMLRTKSDKEFDKVINTYLDTARLGYQSRNSCKQMYSSCKLPYISIKPLINFFFNSKEKKLLFT